MDKYLVPIVPLADIPLDAPKDVELSPIKKNPLESLNAAQQLAYDAVLAEKSIFLTGPGGTGKSFLLNLLQEIPGRNVSLTALTGCAATLLHSKAKTVHSWAGIGLGAEPAEVLISNLKKSRKAKKRWFETDILVIDEVSMMTPELFEKLDKIGRRVRQNNEKPFGGMQLVLVGDFYQLPPVSKDQPTTFVFESPLWKQLGLVTHELTEIVRQKDPIFQQVLNEARRGEMTRKSLKILSRRMGLDWKSEVIKPTMLFARRAQVDQINQSSLKKLDTERRTFKAATVFDPKVSTKGMRQGDPLVQAATDKLDKDAAYSAEFTVAIGAQVMLITNMYPDMGLVNGSRGVIIGYGTAAEKVSATEKTLAVPTDSELLVPLVRFRNGTTLHIPYATWEVPDMPGVLRRQIPLKLAYAITIHRAQGATLDCALIDVGGNTFEYGQAYVALSRARDLESLYIHDLDPAAFRAHPKVKEFYEASLRDSHIVSHSDS